LTRAINSRLSLGFSWNSPFGLGLDYSDGWAGRYAVQKIQLAVIEASPAVGYQVTPWLALGAGFSLEKASFTQRTAVPNLFEPQLGDGRIDMHLNGWGTGFHAGALLNAGTRTRIGLTYRSEVDFSLNGEIVPSNISPAMMAVLPPVASSGIPLSLPQGANASIYREWNRRVALLADAGWADWQRFGRQESKAPDGSTVITDRHWKDTWRVGLGLRWRAGRRTMLHAGASYDSSPVSNRDRTPDLPLDRQWRFAAGVTRDPKPFLSVSLSCSYTALGSAHIEKFLGPIGGRLSGQYGGGRLPFVSLSFDFHSSTRVEEKSRD
jgi:long-chain fatty acid transport protein